MTEHDSEIDALVDSMDIPENVEVSPMRPVALDYTSDPVRIIDCRFTRWFRFKRAVMNGLRRLVFGRWRARQTVDVLYVQDQEGLREWHPIDPSKPSPYVCSYRPKIVDYGRKTDEL